MLKIVDNVDLKELIDKYNFKAQYDCDTGELIELYRVEGRYLGETEKRRQTTTITKTETKKKDNYFKIFTRTRQIEPYCWYLKMDQEDFEILYDLTKAGLVEKVKEID